MQSGQQVPSQRAKKRRIQDAVQTQDSHNTASKQKGDQMQPVRLSETEQAARKQAQQTMHAPLLRLIVQLLWHAQSLHAAIRLRERLSCMLSSRSAPALTTPSQQQCACERAKQARAGGCRCSSMWLLLWHRV
jgi:hypothetical protein